MTEWNKAVKKPVQVEYREPKGEKEVIETREGKVVAEKGEDYVIKGVEGELYPISKEIFDKTYNEVEKKISHTPPTAGYEFERLDPTSGEWGWSTNKLDPQKGNIQFRNKKVLYREEDLPRWIDTVHQEVLDEHGDDVNIAFGMKVLARELKYRLMGVYDED